MKLSKSTEALLRRVCLRAYRRATLELGPYGIGWAGRADAKLRVHVLFAAEFERLRRDGIDGFDLRGDEVDAALAALCRAVHEDSDRALGLLDRRPFPPCGC